MIQIYHNPRCTKSRQGLQLLEASGQDFEVIKYLETPLTFDALKKIIDTLGVKPIEVVRKNEAIWKENFKGKELTDKEVIEAMVQYPKLIERPIVVKNNKAVIGRPTEKINEILL